MVSASDPVEVRFPTNSKGPLSSTVAFPEIGMTTLLVAIVIAPCWIARAQQPQEAKTAPQVKQVLPSYEGQPVAAVELAGQPQLDRTRIQHLVAQKAGEPLSRAKIAQTIEALKGSGEADEVELEIRPQSDGVRVMFVLQPALYFGIYSFPGADRFPYSRLLQVADYPPRGAYSALDVDHTRESLQKFFQKNGYFQSQVQPELQPDAAHGLVNVRFRVTLGRHAKFGKVVFQGAPSQVEPDLQLAVKSWRARLQGAAVRSGKAYSLRAIQRFTQFLEAKLIARDYLGSRVELANTEYDPSTNRADVYFKVESQAPVQVKVEGAHVWKRTLRKLLPIYEQAGLDPELIQEGRQNLVSYFQSKGYFGVTVSASSQSNGAVGSIVYHIEKGSRHRVRGVNIAGNEHLPERELRDRITVEKASAVPFLSRGKFSDQLLRDTVRNLEQTYRAEGYSSVKVMAEVSDKTENITATFRVQEGPRDIVEVLKLEGNSNVAESVLAPRGLKSEEGQAYSAKRVDEDRNQIVAQYLRMGYLNASFRATARKVGSDPHRLEVTYLITEGPKVTVDSVITVGANNTKPSLLSQTVRIKTEAPLREDELLSAENRLYELGIFDWAEIDPRRQITTQTDEDVVVKVHESPRNEIRYGFGFEVINRGGSIPSGTVGVPGIPPTGLPSGFRTSQKTFWGPRGTFQYNRRNFRGLGESITIGLLGARLLQRGGISYEDPYFLGAFWKSNLSISAERNSENPIFTSRTGDAAFQVQRSLNAAGTKTLSLRYDFRKTSLTNLLIPDLVPLEDRSLHLSTLAAAYSYDKRDNPLDATKGMYQTADFDLNLKGLGSSVNFARLRAQAAYYKTVGKGIVWLNTHFWGPYFASMAVAEGMKLRKQGRIVNISSIGGKISVPHLLPYQRREIRFGRIFTRAAFGALEGQHSGNNSLSRADAHREPAERSIQGRQ
jgi:outer membrane protein insertion porin family